MFIKFESKYIDGLSYDDEGDPFCITPYRFIITDSYFIDEWEGFSIWHAILNIYSRRGLNPYSNIVIALKTFCNDRIYSIDYMINMFITDKRYSDINIDELNKYLMLV